MDGEAMNPSYTRKTIPFTITDAKLQIEGHEKEISAQAHTIMELEAYRDLLQEKLDTLRDEYEIFRQRFLMLENLVLTQGRVLQTIITKTE